MQADVVISPYARYKNNYAGYDVYIVPKFFNMHKAEYCHPERSEGSLQLYTEVITVLQCSQYKDSSSLCSSELQSDSWRI